MILGTTLLNGGDAALLVGELEALRLALGDVRATVFDQQPEVARRLWPALELRPTLTWPRESASRPVIRKLRWAWRVLRLLAAAAALRHGRRQVAGLLAPDDDALADLERYRSATVALTPAGTMLVDQYNFLPRLADYLVAVTLQRPLILFTQTVGPFTGRLDRIVGRYLFRRAALVLVRGSESRRHALSLGADPARTHVVADPAFLLTKIDTRDRTDTGLRVAISVREWPFFEGEAAAGQRRYEQAMASLCTHLVRERGAKVTFVSTCQGIPEYWVDDSQVAARIAASVADDVRGAVCVETQHRLPQELRDFLSDFDLVVATRLHAAILALAGGTPTVGVAYEAKTWEVFERVGIADWVVDIDTVDGDALREVVERALLESDARAPALRQAVERERADAAAVADLLREAIADRHDT